MLNARRLDRPNRGSPPPGGHFASGSFGCGWINRNSRSFSSKFLAGSFMSSGSVERKLCRKSRGFNASDGAKKALAPKETI